MILTESGGVVLGSAKVLGLGDRQARRGGRRLGATGGKDWCRIGSDVWCWFPTGRKRARAPKPIIAKLTVAPSASGRSAAAADHSGPHRRDACPTLLLTPPDRETHLPRPDESGASFLASIGPSAGFSPCPAECSPSTRDSPHLQHPPSTPLSTLASHPDKGPTPPAARRQRHERRR